MLGSAGKNNIPRWPLDKTFGGGGSEGSMGGSRGTKKGSSFKRSLGWGVRHSSGENSILLYHFFEGIGKSKDPPPILHLYS